MKHLLIMWVERKWQMIPKQLKTHVLSFVLLDHLLLQMILLSEFMWFCLWNWNWKLFSNVLKFHSTIFTLFFLPSEIDIELIYTQLKLWSKNGRWFERKWRCRFHQSCGRSTCSCWWYAWSVYAWVGMLDRCMTNLFHRQYKSSK